MLRYLIGINCITFFVWGRDKSQAIRQKRRVSEKQLLRLVIAGGGAGALLGQQFFRHKTIKGAFVWKMYVALVARIMVVLLYRGRG